MLNHQIHLNVSNEMRRALKVKSAQEDTPYHKIIRRLIAKELNMNEE